MLVLRPTRSTSAPSFNNLVTPLDTMVRFTSLDSNFVTIIHNSARDLIQHTGPLLEARARESNLIYPHALDLKSKEEKGEAVPPNQLWITCWTKNSRGGHSRALLHLSSPRRIPYLHLL